MTNEVQTVKSISMKLLGDAKKAIKAKHLNKPLITVAGAVDSTFIHGQYEQIGLKGDFLAVNHLTGERYTSNAAFLPRKIATEIMEKQVEMSGAEVEFKVTIKAIESSKSSAGYAFIDETPMTKTRESRMQRMAQAFDDGLPMIESK